MQTGKLGNTNLNRTTQSKIAVGDSKTTTW